MTEKTDSCNGCGQTFPLRQLRYVALKVPGEYVYLCIECRRKFKARTDDDS